MTLAHFTLATRDVNGSAEFFLDIMGWPEIPVPG